MNINAQGVALLKDFEGLRLAAYPDPATGGDPWTIGYGTTKGVRKGMTVTEDQAERLLRRDLAEFEAAVTKLVKVPLTSNQFSALVSWTYNLGVGNLQNSTLLKLLNQGQYDAVPAQMVKWNRANGKVMKGLIRRREAEAALWSLKDEEAPVAVSAESTAPVASETAPTPEPIKAVPTFLDILKSFFKK